MRRVMLVLAAMALMVSLFAAVAYAANITGTNEGRQYSRATTTKFRPQGDDKIFANGGDDKDTVGGESPRRQNHRCRRGQQGRCHWW